MTQNRPRRLEWVGFRCSITGAEYARAVAERDGITFSEALRRLMSLGARYDLAGEAHGRSQQSGAA